MGWSGMGTTRRPTKPGVEADGLSSGRENDPRPRNLEWVSVAPSGHSGARRSRPLPGVGSRGGELTTLGYVLGARGGVVGLAVQCSCGSPPTSVHISNLRRGASTRCNSCAKKASGQHKKNWCGYADIIHNDAHRRRLLNRISACLQRCHNPNQRYYADYGGRGIFVYKPWRADKREFLRYLLTLPGWDTPSLELDRKDNDKGYEPYNLQFSTRAQNMENRRSVGSLQRRIVGLEARLRHCTCGAAQPLHDTH